MFTYLSILLLFSLATWVGVHTINFIRNRAGRSLIDWWVFLIYTFIIILTWLENNFAFLHDRTETLQTVGWILFLFFLLGCRGEQHQKVSFILTPIISFISTLGILFSLHPDPPVFITLNNDRQLAIMKEVEWILLIISKYWLFLAIFVEVVNFRIYLELKYHLPFFFSKRLPHIRKVNQYINRYLILGIFFAALNTTLSLYLHSILLNSSIPGFFWIQRALLFFLVLGYFSTILVLRSRSLTTIKGNLFLLTTGAFINILHFIYY